MDVRLYRQSWDGETLESLLELDRETFGQNPTPFAVIVEGDTALLSMSEGLFRGTRADLDGGNPEPQGGYSVYSSSLPDGVAGPAQDADGDGLANLLEYVLGLDALVEDQGVRPLSLELVSGFDLGLDNDPRDYARGAVRVLREIDDVQLTIRAASVLATLPSGADNVTPIGSPQPDGIYDIHSYRTVFPIDEVSQVFVDLLLEWP